MNLYVLDIKHKNEWKKLVRFESRTFHGLSQMSKWSGIRKHKDFDPFIIWFESLYNPDSSHKVFWFKSGVKLDSSQFKQSQTEKFENQINSSQV